MSSQPPSNYVADALVGTRSSAPLPARFDVFLSHHNADKPVVERIARALQEQGLVPWLDVWELTPGGDWQAELAAGLRASRACAVFVGPRGAGAWSAMEARLALDLAAKDATLRVFPVLLPGVAEPFDPTGLPPFLAAYSWVDLRGGLEDAGAVERLVQAIRGQRGTAKLPVSPASLPDSRPALPPSNLPVQLTSFIGREREQHEVRVLLQGACLVTLTGAGGAGKTRLALAVAGAVLSEYPDGVWLVELAPLADPTLVLGAVAQALGLREEPHRPLLTTLIDHLKERHLLLVLDNCEHLVDACAELVTALLRACPGLGILTTSRETLEVPGETTYRVPSLAVPDLAHLPDPEHLAAYAAVELFVQRARSRRPDFSLSAQNTRGVAEICARLDGMPLAIELAAARVGSLPVDAIAARLDDRFRLLTGGPRTVMSRQQTLRAALDWSHDLLDEPERILLRRLSVFAGGWTLEAAEAVCAGDGIERQEILDLLDALVKKSLVLLDEGGPAGEQGRYRLLETVRQYAVERLGAADQVGEQHAQYYLGLAEQAAPELEGAGQAIWLERLQADHANLRVALGWFLEHGTVERALRLAGALWRFWWVRSHFSEGRQWLDAALAQGEGVAVPVRMAALEAAGGLAMVQGDQTRAVVLAEDLLALARAHGDQRVTKTALSILGMTAVQRGDQRQAVPYLEEALSLARAVGQREDLATALLNLGLAMSEGGTYEAASAPIAEALGLFRATGQTFWAMVSVGSLAYIALLQAEWQRARALLVEYVTLAQQLRDKANLAAGLEGLAALAAVEGQARRAARLFAAAASLRAEIGGRLMSLRNRTMIEEATRSSREQLGEEAWLAAWDAGQAMTVEQAIVYALAAPGASTSPPRGSASVLEPLGTPPAFVQQLDSPEDAARTEHAFTMARNAPSGDAAVRTEPSPSLGTEDPVVAPTGRRLSRTERQAWALAHLRAAGPLSPRQYATALAVSVDTAAIDLRELMAHGLVQAEGTTKDLRYILRVDEA